LDRQGAPLAQPRRSGFGGRLCSLISSAIGIAVGVTIVLAAALAGGGGLFSHVECNKQQAVGTALFWTPYALSNAPYGGSSSYAANFTLFDLFGLEHVVLKDGLVSRGNISAGYFQTENWTVYPQANSSVPGPGMDQPCTSKFGAEQAPTDFSVSVDGGILQGSGNTSNANQPTSFSYGEPNRSAVFSNGFASANAPSISTCGTSAKSLNFSSSSFDISLTIPGSTGLVSVVAVVSSYQNFTYNFPANGGSWLVDDLQENSGLRGPGLAFSWQAC
jgi:hypothetical protein